MKRIYIQLLLAISIVFSLVSCDEKREDVTMPSNTAEHPQGETVTLDIAGALDFGIVEHQDELRYLFLTEQEDRRAPKIDFGSKEIKSPKPLRLYLVKEGEPESLTKIDISSDKVELKEVRGKYNISYRGPIKLKRPEDSFASGTWYISGVYGEGADQEDKEWSEEPFLLLRGLSKEVKLPLLLGWSRIYTKAQPQNPNDMQGLDPKLARNLKLKFAPGGTMLRVRVLNNLTENTYISRLRVKTGELAFSGSFKVTAADITKENLQSGEISLKASSEDEFDKIITIDHKPTRFATSGNKLSKDFFIWVVPHSKTYEKDRRTRISLIQSDGAELPPSLDYSPGKAASGLGWNLGRKLTKINDEGKSTAIPYSPNSNNDDYDIGGHDSENIVVSHTWLFREDRFQTLPKRPAGKHYKSGHVYPINVFISSDLIITEVYTHVGTQATPSIYDSNTTPRYGFVEIYNPTLSDINLADYGLTRICLGRDVASSRVCPDISFDSDANVFPKQSDALVLPLAPESMSKWRVGEKFGGRIVGSEIGGSYQENDDAGGVSSDYPRSTLQIEDMAYRFTWVNTLFGAGSSAPVLKPGKTMIILSSAYLDAIRRGRINSSTFTKNPDDKVSNGIPLIFNKIRTAIHKGFCQYVIALNNDQVDGIGSNPCSAEAGVMTMGMSDAFALVKKTSRGKRIMVDATFTFALSGMSRDMTFLSDPSKFTGQGWVRKRRLPLVANHGVLLSQDLLNRVNYIPEDPNGRKGTNFGVVIDNHYETDYNPEVGAKVGAMSGHKLK